MCGEKEGKKWASEAILVRITSHFFFSPSPLDYSPLLQAESLFTLTLSEEGNISCRRRGCNWVLTFCGYTCFKLKVLEFNRNLTRPEPLKKRERAERFTCTSSSIVTPGDVKGKHPCSHKRKVRLQINLVQNTIKQRSSGDYRDTGCDAQF